MVKVDEDWILICNNWFRWSKVLPNTLLLDEISVRSTFDRKVETKTEKLFRKSRTWSNNFLLAISFSKLHFSPLIYAIFFSDTNKKSLSHLCFSINSAVWPKPNFHIWHWLLHSVLNTLQKSYRPKIRYIYLFTNHGSKPFHSHASVGKKLKRLEIRKTKILGNIRN